ncbi:MAG TPA: ABC transporter ATP-binding protein [bacterium]|nr:ABC transporter ATP-binding protein [bacterium]
MLEVSHLTKNFGGTVAVSDLSFRVEPQTVLGMIGPNGSGKTTSLNCVNGLYRPDAGRVVYQGRDIQGLAPHEVARIGIGRTFQVPKVFKRLTVMENMLAPVLSSHQSDAELHERANALLADVNLADRAARLGEELSGGQMKLLELVRVLMFDPTLILLDEPFAGVHPQMKTVFFAEIQRMREQGKTFILVSHDLTSLYSLCDRIVVMDLGQKIAEGSADEVKRNEQVIEAYLGA